MDGMFRCEECGRLYLEPEAQTILVKGIYSYWKDIEVCPFCGSESGHDWARQIYAEELMEMLEGRNYWKLKKGEI